MYQYFVKMQGLKCSACAKLAKLDLEEVPGIDKVELDDSGQGTLSSSQPLYMDDINNYLKGEYSLKEFNEI